ncbi:hypothetical protein [Streptomyces sp. IB2014 016-6]|nr:hypothetical protein [Streptomyces sp. IB2014 016-6]
MTAAGHELSNLVLDIDATRSAAVDTPGSWSSSCPTFTGARGNTKAL